MQLALGRTRPGWSPAAAGLHPGLLETASIRLRRIFPVLPLPALVAGGRGRAGSGERCYSCLPDLITLVGGVFRRLLSVLYDFFTIPVLSLSF